MHPEQWPDQLKIQAAPVGLRRRLPDARSPVGSGVIDCGSNDYLGLSRHPRVIAAAHAALDEFGAGATASPARCAGTAGSEEPLDRRSQRLKGTESALVFSSGYAANLGLLSAIADREDAIFCDSLDHASLVDGARLSAASLHFYHHADVEHLDRQLSRRKGDGHAWVVTDGVFSMEGTLAPLPALAEVTRKHGATLIIDDAHATAVAGPDGRGSLAHFGLAPDVAIQVGTLSKALGSQGGFVAGPQSLVDMLVQSARAFIYSTGLNPAAAAAAGEALRVSVEEPQWRERAHRNLEQLRTQLVAQGERVYGEHPAPMCAVHAGDAEAAVMLAEGLAEHGVIAPAIRPPTVPQGSSRIRLAPVATMTDTDIGRLLSVLQEVRSGAAKGSSG